MRTAPESHHRFSGRLAVVNRYYDPATGQFLSVDPLVDQTGQPYGYAGEDPANASDPQGLAWYDVFNPWSSNNPIRTGAESDPNGLGTQLVQNVDPAYMAVNGYMSEAAAAQNGAGFWTEAKYGAEGVLGVAGTLFLAVGGGEAAGFVENPDAEWAICGRGFHLHWDDVPHGSMGSHLQIDTWLNGVKGSGLTKRWPWPPWQ